jgi:hypothetical protein
MLAKRAVIWEAAVTAKAAAWEQEWEEWAAAQAVARAVVVAQAVARAVVVAQAVAAAQAVAVVAAANNTNRAFRLD